VVVKLYGKELLNKCRVLCCKEKETLVLLAMYFKKIDVHTQKTRQSKIGSSISLHEVIKESAAYTG